MAEIESVKVWRKKDVRVYVRTVDGKQGCYYIQGNKWQEPETWAGNLTDDEKQRARQLSIWDGKWHTVYDNEMPGRIAKVDGVKVEAQPQPETVSEPSARELPRNRYADYCAACGQWLKPGEGHLVHLTEEEDIDLIGQGKEWIVYCVDNAACEARSAESQAEGEARQARGRDEIRNREREQLIKELAPMEIKMDWSWDDYSYSVGDTLAETENLVAREYKYDGEVIGFVVKGKEIDDLWPGPQTGG